MVREHVRDYLYFHPMRPAQGQKEYRVLIHGWSEEAEAFTDLCMQQGQWPGTLLSVCVETDTETDYLKKRPALINYVDCGNNTPDELLARLRFVKEAGEEEWDYVFDPGQMEDDLKIMKESLKDKDEQRQAADVIMAKEMSVRQAEDFVKRLSEKKDSKSGSKAAKEIDAQVKLSIKEVETRLKKSLGSKVKIKISDPSTGKGKIVIDYKNNEDLDRIINLLG